LLYRAAKSAQKADKMSVRCHISLPEGFNRLFEALVGVAVPLSPLVRRVLAPNPGPFTFRGTGVYLVGAREEIVVLDPGPLRDDHLEALMRAIGPARVSHILITHTHRDHSEAADALKAWSGAKTYGFGPQGDASTGEEADDHAFVPDVRLRDGDVITGDGFTLTVLHTPGHAFNHLCFALEEERALFTGDHVMGWSSSVIAPPDGDMAQYLAALRRLIARDDAILYPTHGAPVFDPAAYMTALLEHRLMREREILAARARGITVLADLVAAIYPGLDPGLRPAAALTVMAHLQKLDAQGPG
jgi:glyoxylase-like metal-dependent hydrolase (beta-lactamase superfamily II)